MPASGAQDISAQKETFRRTQMPLCFLPESVVPWFKPMTENGYFLRFI
jgi:hypothetical protein